MKNSLRKALYITLGIVMLSLTIQERANAREMQRITPQQVQKLDRAMAIETYSGEFLDVTKVAQIKKTFGNVKNFKYGKEIKLDVELFTWEKLDYVDKVKEAFGL